MDTLNKMGSGRKCTELTKSEWIQWMKIIYIMDENAQNGRNWIQWTKIDKMNVIGHNGRNWTKWTNFDKMDEIEQNAPRTTNWILRIASINDALGNL